MIIGFPNRFIKVSFAIILFVLASFVEAGDGHRYHAEQREAAHMEKRRYQLHKKKHKRNYHRRAHQHHSTRHKHRIVKKRHHVHHHHLRHHYPKHHRHHRSTWYSDDDFYWGLALGTLLGQGAHWSINQHRHIRYVTDEYGDCFRVETRARKDVWTKVAQFKCRN